MTAPPLELLYERPGLPTLDLPDELRRLYGGELGLAPTCLVANFVQTIDGVVAIPDLERSNALVAADSDADRFVMGLLRSLADVVLLGAATVAASPAGTWRPERVYPAARDAFAELRRRLGLSERPAVAIVTTGATLDPAHPILEGGAIVLTLAASAPGLRAVLPTAAQVVAVNEGERVDLRAAVAELHRAGFARILSEAGPTTFGLLAAGGLVDELFLTVSPLLAGRAFASPRLGLVEGVELLPAEVEPAQLLSTRRAGDHLFLRYGFPRRPVL